MENKGELADEEEVQRQRALLNSIMRIPYEKEKENDSSFFEMANFEKESNRSEADGTEGRSSISSYGDQRERNRILMKELDEFDDGGRTSIKEEDFKFEESGLYKTTKERYKQYLWLSYVEHKKNKCQYCLGCCSIFVVVFIVSIAVTILSYSPVLFLGIAEGQASESDFVVSSSGYEGFFLFPFFPFSFFLFPFFHFSFFICHSPFFFFFSFFFFYQFVSLHLFSNLQEKKKRKEKEKEKENTKRKREMKKEK